MNRIFGFACTGDKHPKQARQSKTKTLYVFNGRGLGLPAFHRHRYGLMQ